MPDGSLTLTFPLSKGASTKAELPAVLATFPPSPGLSSRLLIAVPSGMFVIDVILPGLNETLSPIATDDPIEIPSVERNRVVCQSGIFTISNCAV